ncbi:MAG: MFS transporter [Thermogutta sp.]|nr:MFS transporter [Thermogutta sp.]
MAKQRREEAAILRIPVAIWVLGFVSLCMDVSSEMIHALLPVFLVSTLGAGTIALGVIEGVAEATASITKVFSGVLSDRLGRRKPLAVFGYGLAALSKPLFPLAASPLWVFVARFVDRIGKGIRGAPRDAMVADCSPPEVRGAAYGLRQSLDTLGALLGPLAAIALMAALANDIRAVFWIATIPALAAVVLLVIGVKEPASAAAAADAPRRLPRWSDVKSLGGRFWAVLSIGAAMALARFSEAFLVLRAHEAGLALEWTPLAFVVMNLTYTISAYPAGRLSDRWGRARLLATGLALLIASDLVLAADLPIALLMVGIALWGFHMGLTQGLLAALVADSVPDSLRGSGFGVFHFVTGVTALAASLVAGILWEWVGPSGTFLASAVFSALAMAGLPLGVGKR